MNGLADAMQAACAEIGVRPPRSISPGRMVRTDTLGKNGKNDAVVLVFDNKRGGIVWNHQTAQSLRFKIDGLSDQRVDPKAEEQRRTRQAEREAERKQVEAICAAIVKGCREATHPYLERKGFPEELGLVCDNPRYFYPTGRLGEMLSAATPECDGPLLIVPGRIGKRITTVQFITPDGEKKNILRGVMSGASHRIATGRDTWVCEGIATALSVRAALRLLGASVTVLAAFSASNVAQVADLASGRIAADHDKPVEALGGLGTGEYYALKSGRPWTMPPALGDFNDYHIQHGLRAVALHLKEALG